MTLACGFMILITGVCSSDNKNKSVNKILFSYPFLSKIKGKPYLRLRAVLHTLIWCVHHTFVGLFFIQGFLYSKLFLKVRFFRFILHKSLQYIRRLVNVKQMLILFLLGVTCLWCFDNLLVSQYVTLRKWLITVV